MKEISVIRRMAGLATVRRHPDGGSIVFNGWEATWTADYRREVAAIVIKPANERPDPRTEYQYNWRVCFTIKEAETILNGPPPLDSGQSKNDCAGS